MKQAAVAYRGLFLHVDRILRGRSASTSIGLGQLMLMLAAAGFLYGAVMGTYAVDTPPRPLQMLYSGLKVPLLLLATFALSLPSFFVLNTLFGLRQDFGSALRALASTQAALTIILASVAPTTALWYLTCRDYQVAILFNAAMFAVASFAAQVVLRRLYRPLIQRNRRHLNMVRLWLLVYAFVGIQMGWSLRPFIGDPSQPTTFVRSGAMTNSYISLANIAASVWRHK